MLGQKTTAAGVAWNITWFTVLGLVVDILFKRAGRVKFLKDMYRSVSEVAIHRVTKWAGESYQRRTSKKVRRVGRGFVEICLRNY